MSGIPIFSLLSPSPTTISPSSPTEAPLPPSARSLAPPPQHGPLGWQFCENRHAFWFGLVLVCVFIALAAAMNVKYRCWQWRTDPRGAAVLEARRRIRLT